MSDVDLICHFTVDIFIFTNKRYLLQETAVVTGEQSSGSSTITTSTVSHSGTTPLSSSSSTLPVASDQALSSAPQTNASSSSVPISNSTPTTTLNQLSPWLVASETLSGPSAAQQAAKIIKESSITRKTVITTQL